MKNTTIVCIHGYGLRGLFWKTFAQRALERNYAVLCPDLSMESPEQAVNQIQAIVDKITHKDRSDIVLIGHSMGGILTALALQKLNHEHITAAILIACPYGSRNRAYSPLLRFLVSHKLIPAYFVRRRFFGPQVKDRVRKAVFAQAVKENTTFRTIVNADTWFHNELLSPVPTIPLVVLSSEADRIVPSYQSAQFAKKMGCRHIVIPASRKIGHDDFGVSTDGAEIILDTLQLI